MNKQDTDQQLISETKSELCESAEKTLALLFDIEKFEMPFDINVYNEIFRTLHSVKGCLSMVGLNPESEIVHQCETLFKQCLEDEKFHAGVIQITIEFLGHLIDYFSDQKCSQLELIKTKNCFKCVVNEKYLRTCPGHNKIGANGESECHSQQSKEKPEINSLSNHADKQQILNNLKNKNCPQVTVTLEKVMLIGDIPVAENYLQKQNIAMTKLSCLEEAYKLGKRLLNVDFFVVNAGNCGGPCLSFVLVINNIAPTKKILIVSDKVIPNFNEMLMPHKMTFTFAGTESIQFTHNLQSFLKVN